MAPTIHFVRHAQGAHNASNDNEALVDPGLTALGEQQCDEFNQSFPFGHQVKYVIASPMRRAIQTASRATAGYSARVQAWDTVQETSDAPNDIGSNVDLLEKEFGEAIDLKHVRQNWNNKDESSVFEPQWDKLLARTQEARRALRDLAHDQDDHIVVVSHGGVLHFLTEDWQGLSLQRRKYYICCIEDCEADGFNLLSYRIELGEL